MSRDAAGITRTGVISNEYRCIKAFVDSLHHAQSSCQALARMMSCDNASSNRFSPLPCESATKISVAPSSRAPSMAALTSAVMNLRNWLYSNPLGPVNGACNTFHIGRNQDFQILSIRAISQWQYQEREKKLANKHSVHVHFHLESPFFISAVARLE